MNENEELLTVAEEDYSFDPSEIDSFELGMSDFREQEGVTYPALLLSNVLFADSLRLLQTLKKRSYREVPVWVEFEDGQSYQNIGTLQLDSDLLLVLRHLRISATVYYDAENWEALQLDSPEVLEKFI